MGKSLHYRTDIDGLRAIAVLAVLFFHADLGFSGGFVGVDIFFVISGYLISGLILKDLDNGQFHLTAFWARRARRILPALAFVVITLLIAGWFFLFPADYKQLGQSVLAQALLVSNIYFWTHSGYFDQSSELMPLLHTWSLAVEEQFYLLFPFFLIAMRRFPRPALLPTACSIGVISFGLDVYSSYFYPSANFYLLPTRAWELLIGSSLAIHPSRGESPRWLEELLAWAGLLAIFCAVFCYDNATRFPGIAALPPCLGAAAIIGANSGRMTSVGRILALPPLVFVGLISYSLYLWHWPLLVFARYWAVEPMGEKHRFALLLLSAILAVLSWKWVETPFRKRTIFKSQDQILSFAGIMTAGLMLMGFTIDKRQGFPSRIPAQALAYAQGVNDKGFQNQVSLKQALNGQLIELGTGDKHLPIRLLVWGDSHAMATLAIFDTLCKEHAVRGVAATYQSTAPLLDFESEGDASLQKESVPFSNAVLKFIQTNHVTDVVLVARWAAYGADLSRLRHCLIETINALKRSGSHIWIMLDIPVPGHDVPRFLALDVLLHRSDAESLTFSPAYYQAERLIQDQAFQGIFSPDIEVLDPAKLFLNPENRLIVAENGKSLFFDKSHLTVVGAKRLRPLLEPIFADRTTNLRQ